MNREVVVYKGEHVIASGTVEDCAKKLGIVPHTINFYASQTNLKRIAARKKSTKSRIAVYV